MSCDMPQGASRRLPPILKRHCGFWMFAATWVLFAILQRHFPDLPAYHDGRYWWEKSAGLADRI